MAFSERPTVPRSRDDAFNDLLVNLSHKMSEENVQELSLVGGLRLNSGYRAPPPTALDVLLGLRNQGEFSPHCCARLREYLQRIYCCDLADLVEQYIATVADRDADPLPEKRHTPIQERRSNTGVIPPKGIATDPPSLTYHSVADSRAENKMSSDLMTPLRQQQNAQGEMMEGNSEQQTITSSSYACKQSTQSQPLYGTFHPNSHRNQETCSQPSTTSQDSSLSLSSQQGSQASPCIAINIHIGPRSDELLHSSLSLLSESDDGSRRPTDGKPQVSVGHETWSQGTQHKPEDEMIHGEQLRTISFYLSDAQEWSMSYTILQKKEEEDVISISNDERREKCHTTNSPAQSVHSAVILSDESSPRPTESPKTNGKTQVSGRHESHLQETWHKPEPYVDEMINGSASPQSFGSPKEGGKWKRFLHLSGRKARSEDADLTPLRPQLQYAQGETTEEHQTNESDQSTHNSSPGDQSQPSYGIFHPYSHTRLNGSQETYSQLSTSSRSRGGLSLSQLVPAHITSASDTHISDESVISWQSSNSPAHSVRSAVSSDGVMPRNEVWSYQLGSPIPDTHISDYSNPSLSSESANSRSQLKSSKQSFL